MSRIRRIEVDETGTAMIYFASPLRGRSVRQVDLVPGRIVADLDREGNIVGIEIFDPAVQAIFRGLVANVGSPRRRREPQAKELGLLKAFCFSMAGQGYSLLWPKAPVEQLKTTW